MVAGQNDPAPIARNNIDLQGVRSPDLIDHIHRFGVVDRYREISHRIQPHRRSGTRLHAEETGIGSPATGIRLDNNARNLRPGRPKPRQCVKTRGNENRAADSEDSENLFLSSEASELYFSPPNDVNRKITRSISMNVPTSKDTSASVTVLGQYWLQTLGQTRRLRWHAHTGKPTGVEELASSIGSVCYIANFE